MRKISCITLLILCFSFFTNAQTVRWGIDPGVALSQASYDPSPGDRRTYTGFDGGGLVEIGNSKKIKFQGEVNYSQVGVELNNGNIEWTIKHSYISIPLMVKYKMDRINVMTGLQLAFRLASKADTSGGNTADVKDQFKSNDFDWVFGGEINVTKHVFVGIRYVLGLTNISERLNFEMKNRYTTFRLGYMFW